MIETILIGLFVFSVIVILSICKVSSRCSREEEQDFYKNCKTKD